MRTLKHRERRDEALAGLISQLQPKGEAQEKRTEKYKKKKNVISEVRW